MQEMIGKKYRDKITGFEGLCTGVCAYISGCNQALLAPKCGDDGSIRDSHWFDVQRLERIGETVVKLDNGSTPGADKMAPIR